MGMLTNISTFVKRSGLMTQALKTQMVDGLEWAEAVFNGTLYDMESCFPKAGVTRDDQPQSASHQTAFVLDHYGNAC